MPIFDSGSVPVHLSMPNLSGIATHTQFTEDEGDQIKNEDSQASLTNGLPKLTVHESTP